MDETIVSVLQEALTDLNVSMPIYASVVPVHAEFPCLKYDLIYKEPWHTKEGTTADKYHLKIYFISKDGGSIDSVAHDSAFDFVYSGAIALSRFIESYTVSGDLTGIRINDLISDFDFEVGVFFITFDVELVINREVIIPTVTMFSIEPAQVGTDTIDGKQVWVRGGIFDKDDFVLVAGTLYTFDTGVNPSGITILEKVAHYYVDGDPTGRIPVSLSLGSGGTLTISEIGDPKPEITKGTYFIWYTID